MPTLYAYVDPVFFELAELNEKRAGRTLEYASFLRIYGTPRVCSDVEGQKGYVALTSGMFARINPAYEDEYATLSKEIQQPTTEPVQQSPEPIAPITPEAEPTPQPTTPPVASPTSPKSPLQGAVETLRRWFSNLSFGSRT
jgi:hypothetical protein